MSLFSVWVLRVLGLHRGTQQNTKKRLQMDGKWMGRERRVLFISPFRFYKFFFCCVPLSLPSG